MCLSPSGPTSFRAVLPTSTVRARSVVGECTKVVIIDKGVNCIGLLSVITLIPTKSLLVGHTTTRAPCCSAFTVGGMFAECRKVGTPYNEQRNHSQARSSYTWL